MVIHHILSPSSPGSAWGRTALQAPPANPSEQAVLAEGIAEFTCRCVRPEASAYGSHSRTGRRSLGDSVSLGGAQGQGVDLSSGTARAVRCRFEKSRETPGGLRRTANKILRIFVKSTPFGTCGQAWCAFIAFVVVSSCGIAAEPNMHIRLKDGSFASGKLVCSAEPQHVGWQCDGFENAFEFDIDAVRAITRVVSPEEEQTATPEEGSLLFELTGGNQVAGKLLSMDDQWLTVESKLLGTIQVSRLETKSVLSIGEPSHLIYAGITADGRWKAVQAEDDWQLAAGSITTTKQGVTISGQIDLPAKSQIKLSLSWRGAPEFVLSLGSKVVGKLTRVADPTATTKIEVWDKQLMLVREVEGSADIAMLADLSEANSKIDLTVYFDQDQGTVAVVVPHGRPMEALTLPPMAPFVGSAVSLTNLGPSVTLERLEVRRWDGALPNAIESDEPIVMDRNGSSIAGLIAGYDSEAQELTIKSSDGKESKLPIASLRRGGVESRELDEDDKQVDRNLLVDIQLMDGTRLSGNWRASAEDRLSFDAFGLGGTIRISPEQIREVLGTSQRYRIDEAIEKSGTMKIFENQLAGHLLANSPDGSRTGLHWQPHGSSRASEIRLDASGSISFPKSTGPVTSRRKLREAPNPGVMAPLLQLFGGGNQANPPEKKANDVAAVREVAIVPNDALEIRFRSGDAIGGKVVRIEERGMTFSSSQTKTDFATHDQIDHIWLNKLRSKTEVSPEKRERLMTVPRSMKKDPPTHLFVSVTGDYLRGRLVRLDGETMTIEVRSELIDLPVAQVSQVVWLHDRDWSETKKVPAGEGQPAAEISNKSNERPFQVHSITNDGHGLSMRPLRVVGGALQGKSDLLGETSVAIKELGQLIFGRDIEEQLVAMRTDPWKLSLAIYPRVYREDESDAGTGALQVDKSPLIGKLAPEFALPVVDGKTFRLSEQHDRIMVLDFWASWCGPCIQTMPLVHEVVDELGTDKIHMLAVNIQETESKARIAMERMQIDCDILLDSDGQTAAAYNAVAIPQTVIIDLNGNVTHVFVGGGAKFVNEFRTSLAAVIALDTPPPATKEIVETFEGNKYNRDYWQVSPNMASVQVQVQDDAVLTTVEAGFQGLAKSVDYAGALVGDFEVRCDIEIVDVPLFKEGWINLELVAIGKDGNFHSMMGIDGNNTTQTEASRFGALYMPSASVDKATRKYTFVSHNQTSSKGTLCLQRIGDELISGVIEDGVLLEIKRYPCDRTPMTLQIRGFFGEETVGPVKFRIDNLKVLPVTAQSQPVKRNEE